MPIISSARRFSIKNTRIGRIRANKGTSEITGGSYYIFNIPCTLGGYSQLRLLALPSFSKRYISLFTAVAFVVAVAKQRQNLCFVLLTCGVKNGVPHDEVCHRTTPDATLLTCFKVGWTKTYVYSCMLPLYSCSHAQASLCSTPFVLVSLPTPLKCPTMKSLRATAVRLMSLLFYVRLHAILPFFFCRWTPWDSVCR